jgi:hypothetical protein
MWFLLSRPAPCQPIDTGCGRAVGTRSVRPDPRRRPDRRHTADRGRHTAVLRSDTRADRVAGLTQRATRTAAAFRRLRLRTARRSYPLRLLRSASSSNRSRSHFLRRVHFPTYRATYTKVVWLANGSGTVPEPFPGDLGVRGRYSGAVVEVTEHVVRSVVAGVHLVGATKQPRRQSPTYGPLFGTTLGPHAVRGGERPARLCTSCAITAGP